MMTIAQTGSESDLNFVTPSAFSAAEIQIEEFIDLEQFPIHDLKNPRRQKLVELCRNGLRESGCAHIANFIRPEAIIQMQEEAERLMPYARQADGQINPYLTPDDPTLPNRHPKRFFEPRTSSFINANLLEEQSMLRKIYDCDVVIKFLADCLESGPIFRWADPLARNPYSVMKENDYFPWHFDGNDFTISVLVQESDKGGIFEWVPDLRTSNDERFDEVTQVLFDGDRTRVKTLPLKCGDLQLFKGRYSMHRVTVTRGKPRIIALPTYVTNPYIVNRPHHAKAFYGETLPIHHEREMDRADSLMD